ncbi:MAG: 30S ribosomal protein S11 [Candidatus Pacebacteria bacterium]|jgi:small subunit ribosomal protein S11|nr:30S ribosomal protein S11 [Candidatus Paceibacterota bacterium]MDD3072123.1 30S ribosomal protein S11 [Candidatus Paceibacterota bacterium]MDD3728812.1 30S ribosomal protein S11 [Candidatus Paceibacterota bacterium]MDD4201329.1 30S ribosomal protein S11 [Candidatus Paceibacterota bacterium]MDD4467001.1 30S ribosomal protein S11 [Candidatus Paceibacterota bacterium]
MGKKRIIKKTDKELLDEKDKIEGGLKKETKSPKRILAEGKIYISSTYNNTIMTLSDAKGNALSWVSAGSVGFKGTKKATPFAASKVAESLFFTIQKLGIEKVDIFVKGIGSGRESAIRALIGKGINVNSIKDVTPVPHNGCRPKKPRKP